MSAWEHTFEIDDYRQSAERELSCLTEQKQIAFAAWCCKRLLPAPNALDNSLSCQFDFIREILDSVWQYIVNAEVRTEFISGAIRWCLDVKCDDDCRKDIRNQLEDALAAVYSTLEGILSNTLKNVALVGETAFEAAHHAAVDEYTCGEPTVFGPEAASEMLEATAESPFVKREIEIQTKQLDYLLNCGEISLDDRHRFDFDEEPDP